VGQNFTIADICLSTLLARLTLCGYHPHTKSKKLVFKAISLSIGLFFALTLGEIGIRVLHNFQKTKAPIDKLSAEPTLGWVSKPDLKFNSKVKDLSGDEYLLNLNTDHNGFRHFGSTSTAKKRVLFIGDSFTQAVEVSDEHHYGKILSDSLDFEPFIYGSGGWGNLQELMFLEQWMDQIKPDLVVLQFCTNDIINNSYELERNSFFNNSRMTRPYFLDEKLVYKNPAYFKMEGIKKWSKLLPFIATRIERGRDYYLQKNEKSSEHLMLQEGLNYKPFAEAVNQTELIFQKIKTEVESEEGRLIVFSVDHFEPCSNAVADICSKNEIEYEDVIPYHLENERKSGTTIYAADGAHWNRNGHAITAKYLMPRLKKLLSSENKALPHSQ